MWTSWSGQPSPSSSHSSPLSSNGNGNGGGEHGTPSSYSHYPDTPPTPSSWTAGPSLPAFNLNFLPSIPSFFTAQASTNDTPGTGDERLTALPERVAKTRSYDARVSSLDLGGYGGGVGGTRGAGGRSDYEHREREREEDIGMAATGEEGDASAGGGGGWRDYFLARGVVPVSVGSPHDSGYGDSYGTGTGSTVQSEWKSKSQRESTQYLLGKGGRPFSYDTAQTGRQPLLFRNEATSDDVLEEVERSLARGDSLRSHRSKKSSLSLPTLSLISGFLTLLNVLWSGFIIFESVYGLVNYGPQDARGMVVVRWVEIGVGALSVFNGMISIGWLQLRHPTNLSLPILLFTTLIFILHLGLSLACFALVFIWYPETLRSRCTWGIDPVWILGSVGEVCNDGHGASLGAWAIAAGIRVVVVILIGSALLLFMRLFHRSLSPPEPPAQPSASDHPDRLPPMPDHSEFYSLDTHSSLGHTGKEVGWASWIGGKVLGGLAWLVGLDAPEEETKGKEKAPLTGRSGSEEMREKENVRMGMGSESLPGQRGGGGAGGVGFMKPMRPISWEMPPPQPHQSTFSSPRHLHDPQQQQYRDYQQQQYYTARPPYFQHQDEHSRPTFQPSPALRPELVHPPALQPHYSPTASSYLQTPASAYRDSFRAASPPSPITSLMLDQDPSRRDEYYEGEEVGGERREYEDQEGEEVDLDRTPPTTTSSRFPSGSSGSTGGAYVYVRMSDGKLVRKLSTIVSESSAGNWTGAGTDVDGSGGRRSGSGGMGRQRTVSNGTTGSNGSEPKSPGWRKKVPSF